jgi:Ferritin-like
MIYRQEKNYRRHRLIQNDSEQTLAADVPRIRDIKALREALQFAVYLEHFTIPPYLCALYSIHEGTNAEAARIIRSVAMEEMLHMVLAANILNAIGGKPIIGVGEPLPVYPDKMPHSAIGFQVNLLRFSKDAINTFLRIERPAAQTKPTEPGRYWSIGDFYKAVTEALRRLDGEASKLHPKGIFTGTQKQVTEEYYGSGGKVFGVYNLHDAERALEEIVGQGEGINGHIQDGDGATFGEDVEYAHYFRFNEVFQERRYRPEDKPTDAPSGARLPVDWNAVYNMIPNPKMSMFRSQPVLLGKMLEFNRRYLSLLKNLHTACNGKPEILGEGIPMMHAMRLAAIDLMQEPCHIGDYTAGPSFELVR